MKKKPATANPAKENKSKIFPIVGIGASAGGLEAVSELLQHLPADTGMAYVYIQHLDPTHQSMVSSILSRITKMPVAEATQKLEIKADHVYVIPPNQDLTIVGGVLTLNERKAKPTLHVPIDQFFMSLAEDQKERAIGIVLSGSATDGTIGLKAIKTAGGLTFVQDESAKFQSMPRSAIAEGVADLVLSPQQIAKELEKLSTKAESILELTKDGQEEEISNLDQDLAAIIQMLKKSTAVDFTHYKMNTIKRRIIRRMLLHKLETLSEYLQYIKSHQAEINILFQDLLINVTNFFRDQDAFEFLKKNVFPQILKNKSSNDPLRVWVPACSTGEEAYSIAITLMEVLGDKANNIPVQIFATDLSELAISKARLGLYSRNDLADVSPRRLRRFFTQVDGNYRVIKSVRDLVVFAPHNIFKDPPFSRLDFVSCCNLMIFLDTVLQKKIIATFHYALNANGYLMLGRSETIGASGQLFSQVEKKYKIYARKKDAAVRAIFDMTHRLSENYRAEHLSHRTLIQKESKNTPDLEKIVDNVLLTKYTPPSLVVNQDLEILQFRGSTGMFLEPSPGKASLNLLKMAKAGLAFELRNAIHKSNKSGGPVRKSGLKIKHDGNPKKVAIEVCPLPSQGQEKLYLVVLQDLFEQSVLDPKASFSKDKLVKQLQEELQTVREDMRSIVEEQEASIKELQSANEEIVSTNEELQSINKELGTSKEEVESTNEELMTINTELQMRNEQLAEAYEYMEAVFGTIREAVIVLDKELRVKTANRSFHKIFQTKEEDIQGLLLYEVKNRQWDIPKMHELLEDLIPSNGQYHGIQIKHEFPELGEKLLIINAKKIVQKIHRQHLILIAIEDITDLHRKTNN